MRFSSGHKCGNYFFSAIYFLLLLITANGSAQSVLLDDFNRANNNVVGLSWGETETVSPTSATVNTNMLRMGSTTAGIRNLQ